MDVLREELAQLKIKWEDTKSDLPDLTRLMAALQKKKIR